MEDDLFTRRNFCYSSLSLIWEILLISFSWNSNADLIRQVSQEKQFPWVPLLLLTVAEVGKVWLTVGLLYPSPTSGGSGRGPFGRRIGGGSNKPNNKIVEFLSVCWRGVLSVGLCHLFLVLFGAPLFRDFLLTLEFSLLLASWYFGPLCLVISPKNVIREVAFISMWNTEIPSHFWAKLRLLTTLAGTVAGAVFFPLDWDRPWQIWPIPCFYSTFFALVIIDAFVVLINILKRCYPMKSYGVGTCNKVKSF